VYPVNSDNIPTEILSAGSYELRFVRDNAELDAIFRLRFDVFNIELEEGLESSYETERDADEFDPVCHHLYVIDTNTGCVVGTYRMQTVRSARQHIGLYSETEFDFSGVPEEVLQSSVEVGRACIHIEHRSLKVLYLLWRGLGLYVSHNDLRYLFGCCSLTSQDHAEGLAVLKQLQKQGNMLDEWSVVPLPGHVCCRDEDVVTETTRAKIPRLMRAYLTLGAKICGPPAIDRVFKTIDYIALFDVKKLSRLAAAFYRVDA
jgi:putative hemolysin